MVFSFSLHSLSYLLDQTKLNSKFDLDGTHMNPLYLYAVERELGKYF
jgi:hypothetical protein